MKDQRHAIRGRIATKEAGEHVSSTGRPVYGNLALAENTAPVEVTRGDERAALIEVLVTGLIGCWVEMNAPDCNKILLRRSLVELRNLARNQNITAEEIVNELAKRGGVDVNLVLVIHRVEEEEQTPVDEIREEIKHRCPSIPEVRPQGRANDPHRYIADDDLDLKTGLSHTRFVAAGGASDLYVTKRRPAGMTSGKNIPRDPDSGRFTGVTA